jgi:hypothetical protein
MLSAVDDRIVLAITDARNELEQAIALLSAAGVDDPRRLTIGEGDRMLLAVYRAVTGTDLALTSQCPECEVVNEIVFGADSVPALVPCSAWAEPGAGLRQPTYADLIDLPPDGAHAGEALVDRVAIGPGSGRRPPELLDVIDDSLSGTVDTRCVECATPLSLSIDIAQLVLQRTMQRVEEVDYQIHLLASTYRWELATIESLPSDRRTRLARFVTEGR